MTTLALCYFCFRMSCALNEIPFQLSSHSFRPSVQSIPGTKYLCSWQLLVLFSLVSLFIYNIPLGSSCTQLQLFYYFNLFSLMSTHRHSQMICPYHYILVHHFSLQSPCQIIIMSHLTFLLLKHTYFIIYLKILSPQCRKWKILLYEES